MISRHVPHDQQRPTLGYGVAVHIDRGQTFAERVALRGFGAGGDDEGKGEGNRYKNPQHDEDGSTLNRLPSRDVTYNLQRNVT